MVAFIIACIAVIGIPFSANLFANFRLGGDARMVLNHVSLTKMKAASNFTKARLYVDLAARSHHIDVLDKSAVPPAWNMDGGTVTLAQNDNYGFGGAAAAPPNTQVVIAQAPACLTNAGAPIANTACIIFNSRGVPVDTLGAPTGLNAIYLNDGITLYCITLSATGQVRLWRGMFTGATGWLQQ
jgi:hypothetical protein